MKTDHPARIQDLLGLVNALYPPQLAESWDNVGLQAGDPAAPLTKVLISLDPSESTVAAAQAAGAEALLTHHPLIFKPLKQLTPGTETGRILLQAIRGGVAVLSAHTNLDRAADGLNDWLATRLGIDGALPLAAGDGNLVKLVVFVPSGYEEVVAEALFQAGAGHLGQYDSCAFRTPGTGTFRPLPPARPFLGQTGIIERAHEIRLETIVPQERVSRVIDRMLKAHPYEEVAYDLIPLANRRPGIGLGRIGRLPEALTLEVFAGRVKQLLGAPAVRLVGDGDRRVTKVAVCGGSGASLLQEAARQGADVLVTGDLKYHEARQAQHLRIAAIDAGHFATERLAVPKLAEVLRREATRRGLAIEFIELEGEADPFYTV